MLCSLLTWDGWMAFSMDSGLRRNDTVGGRGLGRPGLAELLPPRLGLVVGGFGFYPVLTLGRLLFLPEGGVGF